MFKALVHAGATGYGSPDFGKALGPDGNGPFVLAEPVPGLKLDAFRPEAQKLEREFTEAIKKRAGTEPYASHRLAGAGLWLLKLVLDKAGTDELEKFRSAVMSLDLPVGSMLNGWGVKFAENGQNANERVQHYMLQWQNGQMTAVWPEEFTTARAKWRSRSAPGTSGNRLPRPAPRLDGPAGGDLRPHRGGPHADLRDHAGGQLRPWRVPDAGNVRRVLSLPPS